MIEFEMAGRFKQNGRTYTHKVLVEDGNIMAACEYLGDKMLKVALKNALKNGDEKLFMNLLRINHGQED